MKTCKTCGIQKLEQSFPRKKRAGKADHVYPDCKACLNDRYREYHREKRAQRRADPDKYIAIKQQQEAYYLNNHAKCRASASARLAERVGDGQRPRWADVPAMRDIYEKAYRMREQGHDVVVDHVIPLRGDLVCGLHVETNLAIITRAENSAKGNRLTEADGIGRG